MNKKALSERDICTKYITPALKQAGWDEFSQIREEVSFTKGRIIVRGGWSPAAKPSAPTTSFITSPTSPSPLSRPRTTTTALATAPSRPSNTPTPSISPSSSPAMATASCSTIALGPARRRKPPSPWKASQPPPASGPATGPGKASPPRLSRSCSRITLKTPLARPRAITSATPSTPPLKPSPTA